MVEHLDCNSKADIAKKALRVNSRVCMQSLQLLISQSKGIMLDTELMGDDDLYNLSKDLLIKGNYLLAVLQRIQDEL